MKENETWFDFMDRAKKNGNSPTMQEALDREDNKNEPNSSRKNIKRERKK
jgi:hypothetical protein